MWICTRCGERNEDGAPACSNCAAPEALVCPRCRAEYRAGITECADCAVPLADPAKLSPVPTGRLCKVWSCVDHTQAELLRVALRRGGIESRLDNVGGAMYAIGIGTSVVPYVIVVAEHDGPRALEIIKAEIEVPPPSDHPDRYIPPVAMIEWPCACGQTLEVPPDFEGMTMDCPFCGRAVTARKTS